MEPFRAASALLALENFLGSFLSEAVFNLTFSFRNLPGDQTPAIVAEFSGPDTGLLLTRNAELLLALEHLAFQALRLTPEQHELISFDAGGFKQRRDRMIKRVAADAVRKVNGSGQPFRFAPMTSRERRLLHLALASSGLLSKSEGDGSARHLVLHPVPRM